MITEYLVLKSINNLKENGGIYLELSNGSFSNVFFQKFKKSWKCWKCFLLLESRLFMNKGSFSNYSHNCMYGEKSNIVIKDSNFNNENGNKTSDLNSIYKYGTIYCDTCYSFSVSNSIFLVNRKVFSGGSVGLSSNQSK